MPVAFALNGVPRNDSRYSGRSPGSLRLASKTGIDSPQKRSFCPVCETWHDTTRHDAARPLKGFVPVRHPALAPKRRCLAYPSQDGKPEREKAVSPAAGANDPFISQCPCLELKKYERSEKVRDVGEVWTR